MKINFKKCQKWTKMEKPKNCKNPPFIPDKYGMDIIVQKKTQRNTIDFEKVVGLSLDQKNTKKQDFFKIAQEKRLKLEILIHTYV